MILRWKTLNWKKILYAAFEPQTIYLGERLFLIWLMSVCESVSTAFLDTSYIHQIMWNIW